MTVKTRIGKEQTREHETRKTRIAAILTLEINKKKSTKQNTYIPRFQRQETFAGKKTHHSAPCELSAMWPAHEDIKTLNSQHRQNSPTCKPAPRSRPFNNARSFNNPPHDASGSPIVHGIIVNLRSEQKFWRTVLQADDVGR